MEKIQKNYQAKKVGYQLFDNLNTILKYRKNIKIKSEGNRIKKLYVKIPFSVAIQYSLLGKLEMINGESYAWVRPVVRNNKLKLYYKKRHISATHVFGRSINKIKR